MVEIYSVHYTERKLPPHLPTATFKSASDWAGVDLEEPLLLAYTSTKSEN
jgi:hypothetical protein